MLNDNIDINDGKSNVKIPEKYLCWINTSIGCYCDFNLDFIGL